MSRVPLPLFIARVPAGFPSPAADYAETSLDLNELLVQRPAATYMVRAEGESMVDAGIFSGDILIVDRSLEPRPGQVVIAAVAGSLTVKVLEREEGRLFLAARNASSTYPRIPFTEDTEVWGVVTASIRNHRG